ncbi:helix-turn-helix domain-containing protein [Polynucleobacter sp. Fuers-14]|uniref:helix-turn-helix domain-containing protein n=1 Tax=Polynucleobacter sp. Fuers-14 TaxID=1758364 RepID=UPI001C0AF4B0|nr:helix-turn-helix domain-containing protein [Polynucleobacter sp. Fuers-14]MBU3640819.1 helix-turn-helix domain-containing protein [Polynucleobacter sp. Fuers-14]
MTIYEFNEWRFRLGLSVQATAELLGVSRDTVLGWQIGKHPISKQTQLATLACEIAYIGAKQFIKANPSSLNNFSLRNQSEFLGRKNIREGIIDGRNILERELPIVLAPKSLIHYIK